MNVNVILRRLAIVYFAAWKELIDARYRQIIERPCLVTRCVCFLAVTCMDPRMWNNNRGNDGLWPNNQLSGSAALSGLKRKESLRIRQMPYGASKLLHWEKRKEWNHFKASIDDVQISMLKIPQETRKRDQWVHSFHHI